MACKRRWNVRLPVCVYEMTCLTTKKNVNAKRLELVLEFFDRLHVDGLHGRLSPQLV
jgi:hypothetical protein